MNNKSSVSGKTRIDNQGFFGLIGIIVIFVAIGIILWGVWTFNTDWGLGIILIGVGVLIGGFGGEATMMLPGIGTFAGMAGFVIIGIGFVIKMIDQLI